jgi:hypothetical protein
VIEATAWISSIDDLQDPAFGGANVNNVERVTAGGLDLGIHGHLSELTGLPELQKSTIKVELFQRRSMISYCKLVLTKSGRPPKNDGTASSMMLWPFTKLRLASGCLLESMPHLPGLGTGSLILGTGSQFEFEVSCSLNAPSNVSRRSRTRKAQIALADMLFRGVVKTA